VVEYDFCCGVMIEEETTPPENPQPSLNDPFIEEETSF